MVLIRAYHLALLALAGTVIVAVTIVNELGNLPLALGAVLLAGAGLLYITYRDLRDADSAEVRAAISQRSLEHLASYAEQRADRCLYFYNDYNDSPDTEGIREAKAELQAARNAYLDVRDFALHSLETTAKRKEGAEVAPVSVAARSTV